MRRTKEWWNRLSKGERIRLVYLEHAPSGGYGGGGYLPDDCSECGGCSQPMLGCGLCQWCSRELSELIGKADGMGL